MANEILYRADMICQLLGEGKRHSDQTRAPLSQCAVESLDVIGDAQELVDDSMLLFGNDPLIRTPAIGIEPRMLAVVLGY